MSDGMPQQLRRELLDDFYTECDELFGSIRTELGVLERCTRASLGNRVEGLEALYRHLHSLKGNCGIIGLRPAEELSHAAEDVLRRLLRERTAPAPDTLRLLAQGVQRLEEIVSAHRLEKVLPDFADLRHSLQAFGSHTSESGGKELDSLAPAASDDSASRAVSDAYAWHATFSPSPELAERGVNLNSVRERLSALGRIVHASPVIRADRSMIFDFTLEVSTPPPLDQAAWAADGIVLRPPDPSRPAAPSASEVPAVAPAHIVRVPLDRLDELMRIMGDLVIHRSRLEERIMKLPGDRSGLQEVNNAFARSLRDLRAALTRVRLVSVSEVFSRLPYMIRDLARESGKQIRLVVEGENTEIDKYLVERLKEPLLHLVRNSISHGIESPPERAAAGKPEEATLLLRASSEGPSILIEVRDDGRGIDPDKILARARDLELAVPSHPTAVDVLAFLCRPGFSTREEADLSSGRGVGMAVVQNTVRRLGGSLSFATEPGEWTQFMLRLPLTLSIADTLIVSAAGQICAVPQGMVQEILQIAESSVRIVQRVDVAPYRGALLPLVRLRSVFAAAPSENEHATVLVLNSDRGLTGLVVDRVIGQREVVVHAMQDPLLQLPGVSGATELGDGKPVLILDPIALSHGAVHPHRDMSSRGHIPLAS